MFIHTTGHPRSGNTWIGKLLSDAVGGLWLPAVTAPGIRTFAPEPIDNGFVNSDIIVTKNHRTDIPRDNPVVLVYRDPRDVMVSVWHYRNKSDSLYKTIEDVLWRNDPANDFYGGYERLVRSWWNIADAQVSYEELHQTPAQSLERVLNSVGLSELVQRTGWKERLNRVIERQKFDAVKNSDPQAFAHSMRKGVIGDWRNYLDADCLALIYDNLGALMEEQGYAI